MHCDWANPPCFCSYSPLLPLGCPHLWSCWSCHPHSIWTGCCGRPSQLKWWHRLIMAYKNISRIWPCCVGAGKIQANSVPVPLVEVSSAKNNNNNNISGCLISIPSVVCWLCQFQHFRWSMVLVSSNLPWTYKWSLTIQVGWNMMKLFLISFQAHFYTEKGTSTGCSEHTFHYIYIYNRDIETIDLDLSYQGTQSSNTGYQ